MIGDPPRSHRSARAARTRRTARWRRRRRCSSPRWRPRPSAERNFVRWAFLGESAKEQLGDWPVLAAETVAVLRVDSSLHPDDRALHELVGELAVRSAESAPSGTSTGARVRERPGPFPPSGRWHAGPGLRIARGGWSSPATPGGLHGPGGLPVRGVPPPARQLERLVTLVRASSNWKGLHDGRALTARKGPLSQLRGPFSDRSQSR